MQPLSQSSLKQQIVQLEQEVEEYRILFDTVPVKIWFKDTANRVLKVNRPAAEFEGKSVEEMQGKSSYQLYPKDIAEAYYQHDLKVIQSGEPVLNIVEPHVIPSTGEKMWVETGKVPYYGASANVGGVIAFAVDVTEREHVKEKLNDVSSAVDKLTQMVESDTDKAEILDYLETLRTALSDS